MKDLIANIFYKLVDAEYARIGTQYRDYGDVAFHTLLFIVIIVLLFASVVAYVHYWWIDKRAKKAVETEPVEAEPMTYYDECVARQNAATASFELELAQMKLMNELYERFDPHDDPFKEMFADFPRIE